MVFEVKMPKLGLTMEKGAVIRWLKTKGDKVSEGEPLLEIETDKSVVEVPSPKTGYLREILVPEKQTVKVGTIIAYISESVDEEVPKTSPDVLPPEEETKQAAVTQTPGAKVEDSAPSERRLVVSPKAKKMAEKLGVNISSIKGSGPGGRIVASDVEQAAQEVTEKETAPLSDQKDKVEVSQVRQIIASRMLESARNIPQFSVAIDVDMSRSMHYLDLISTEIKQRIKIKPTITDLLIKASAKALSEHKEANAYFVYDDNTMWIQYNKEVNIGVAVDTKEGLLVPVLKTVNSKNVEEICKLRYELVEKARVRRLHPDEMSGGTFTVSNMGTLGISSFCALVNPPESAILASGSVINKVVAVEEAIVLRPILNLTLTADHRILDGAVAGRLLKSIAGFLERSELD